ncbi:hypothetical protein BH11CYA1_BH11CYA1_06240 [soil metagenome]
MWLVFKEVYLKDLKHSFRDKDVFIYTFVVPALLYPSLLVGSAELVMFKADSESAKSITYAVSGPTDKGLEQIDAILQKRKHFKKVETKEADKDLADGKVDAVLVRKDNFIELRVNQLLKVATLASTINDNVSAAYLQELTEAFASKGFAKENSQGFAIVSQNITASGNTQKVAGSLVGKSRLNKLENLSPTLCLLIFSLLMLGLGAAYPSIAVTAEEFERNTIETSCLLPVSRSMIMLGKVIAVSTFAAVSGLVNFVSMYAVAALVLSQAKLFPRFTGEHLAFNLHWSQAIGLVACYLLLALLISALMIFATSFCRTVRSAQQWTTFPLLIILLLPPCALFPNLELNYRTMWLPILNCTLMLKAIFSGVPFNYTFVVVTYVSLAVSFAALSLARIFLFEQVDPGAAFGRAVDGLAHKIKKKETRA